MAEAEAGPVLRLLLEGPGEGGGGGVGGVGGCRAEVEEYERGHGAGPQGTREVNFCNLVRTSCKFYNSPEPF